MTMSTDSYFLKAQKLVPFTLQGRQGRVAVYYGPNDDAVKAGFDTLSGIDFPIELCLGYPVMQAQIERYAGSGYRTLCGWIQIITRECYATADTERTNLQRSCSIDVLPAMHGAGVPWACFGNLPSLFDAPCRNLGDNAELTWIADTFLTTVPLRSRDAEICWLLGFRWGYREYDTRVGKPVTLLPLESTDAQVWNDHLPFLRKEFGDWRFHKSE
jgi:hypothetical protein